MKITQFWLRCLGFAGILGGLLLFVGDMLFYYDVENTDFLVNMGKASDNRIIVSTVTALLAAWFYMLGLAQVYVAFKPSKPIVRTIVLLCFGAILISYGVIHGAYVAIATTAKVAMQNGLDITKSTALASKANDMLRLLVYPIFALLSVIFIFQVWKKKTLYPRWIVFFFPLIPFLLQGFIGKLLSGSLKIIVIGGYLNIMLIVFFLASTIALWSYKSKKS